MEDELDKYKNTDGTVDWGRYAMERLERLNKKSGFSNRTNRTNGTNGTNGTKKPGGYRNLLVYQQAVVIYDLTIKFCQRFLNEIKDRRTIEQMTQAARSGKQNIVEASLEKSLKMNIKLTGVARGSFGELLEDYQDFLRTRQLALWDKNDPRVREIRAWRVRPNWSNGIDGSNGIYGDKIDGSNGTNGTNGTNGSN